MNHQPVGMSPLPAGVGVSGKAGMDHGDSGFKIFALKIRIKGPQLSHQKHPLIHDSPAGKRNHVGILGGLLEKASGDIKLPVKLQSLLHSRGSGHKALHNMRHAFHGSVPQHPGEGRHLPPAQKLHPFFRHNDFKHLFCLIPAQLLLGKEKHSHPVLSLSSEGNSQLRRHPGKKLMGNLGQNTHAVSGFPLGVLPGPVLQIFHDLQGVFHRHPALLPSDIHTGADPATVMLKFFPVQRRQGYFLFCIKHTLYSFPIRQKRKEALYAPLRFLSQLLYNNFFHL